MTTNPVPRKTREYKLPSIPTTKAPMKETISEWSKMSATVIVSGQYPISLAFKLTSVGDCIGDETDACNDDHHRRLLAADRLKIVEAEE
jgi:hypothetical protein